MNEASGRTPEIGFPRRRRIQEAVISWLENNARDLLWRRTRDPSWLLVAVESLHRDGLAKVLDEPTRREAPVMVAEGRMSYGAGSGELPRLALHRMVSLP